MAHLDGISLADLQAALDEVEGKKPTKRLIAAIAYKRGVSQTELAGWFGVQRKTIYSWLTRLDEEPLAQAVLDADRPGRPRKLAETERERLTDALGQPPREVGCDRETWTPALVREFVRETFDVEYSLPSCRRLMKEAGLRYCTGEGAQSGVDRDGTDSDGEGSGRWLPR